VKNKGQKYFCQDDHAYVISCEEPVFLMCVFLATQILEKNFCKKFRFLLVVHHTCTKGHQKMLSSVPFPTMSKILMYLFQFMSYGQKRDSEPI